MAPIVFYGASGHALALAQNLQSGYAPAISCQPVGFIDDLAGDCRAELARWPIMDFAGWRRDYPDVPCLLAVGSPKARERLAAKVTEAGGTFAAPFRHRPVSLFPDTKIGTGTFVGSMCFVGPFTTIGDHVQIMPLCSIGHDVVIEDYCTVCPSCTISGHVIIEEGAYIGAGSTIVNGTAQSPIRIGRHAKVWAGSVVIKSVPHHATFAGNPAICLRDIVDRRRSLELA